MFVRDVSSVASTFKVTLPGMCKGTPVRRPWFWLICVPPVTRALVVMENTSTITEPLTAAPSSDPAAARATEEKAGSVPMTGTLIGSASLIEDLAETSIAPTASICTYGHQQARAGLGDRRRRRC